jgi:cell division protein FtsQ
MKKTTSAQNRSYTPRANRNRYRGAKKAKKTTRKRNLGPAVRSFFAALWRTTKMVTASVLIISLLGGVSVGLVMGYHYVVNAQYFMVRKVVLNGLDRISRDEVLKATELDKPANILALNLADMAGHVETLPWVRTVTVSRKLPDTILVNIVERRPRVLVSMDALYYLDETGTPFKKVDPKDNPELPIVTGFTRADLIDRREHTMNDLLEVFDLLDALAERNDRFRVGNISEINFDAVRGLSLFTRNDKVQVKIGRGDYRQKLRRLGRVLAHLKIKGQADGVTYFNLECSPRVIVRRPASKIEGEGNAT